MLKRPLVPTTILFLLGIFLVAYGVNIIIKVILCLAVCGLILLKTKRPYILLLAILLIFAGMFRMTVAENNAEEIKAYYSGKKEVMRFTIADFSSENSATAYFQDGGKRHKVLLRYKSDTQLFPGDIVEGEVALNRPNASKVKFPGYVQTLAGNNVFLIANADEIAHTGEREGGIFGAIKSLRVYMDKLGEKHFTGDDRALFNAMVIGDKRLISDELYTSLKAGGLNHIAVVSGMHLSVAIVFIMAMAHLVLGKRRIGYIFVLAGAFVLVILTGAGTSAVRAFIMCTLFISAKILYRDNDSPTALSFAAFLMVMINPFIIFNLGFILSVLSVGGILLYNEKLKNTFTRIAPDKMAEGVSLSLSAQLAVLPVAAHYFSTIAPYSLLSNALLVPVAAAYVILGMVFVILSQIPFLPDIIAFVMRVLSGCISSVSGWVADLPASLISVEGSIFVFFAIWVILLVLLAMHPIKNKRLAFVSVAVAFLCIVTAAPEEKAQIYPITYGDETMTVMSFPKKDSILIDYPDSYDVSSVEDEKNPFTTLVLSANSPGEVFNSDNDIERIIAFENAFYDEEREKLIAQARGQNIHLILLQEYEKVQIGSAVMEYLPVVGLEDSCIVKVYYDGKTYLSFQGMDGTDLVKINESGLQFESDYVILPYTAKALGGDFFTGEIIE